MRMGKSFLHGEILATSGSLAGSAPLLVDAEDFLLGFMLSIALLNLCRTPGLDTF